jgi:transposase
MRLFVGLDVSLEKAAICAISEHGKRSSWSASPRRSWAGSPIRTAQSPPSGSRLVPCRKGCIARLLHLGWVRPAHGKSVSAQEVRAAFTARKAVQQEVITLEMSLRGLPQGRHSIARPVRTGYPRAGGRQSDAASGNRAHAQRVIGAVISLTYRSAVDDPDRFTSSKKVGPWVGLTSSRNQSCERDILGRITKAGDVNLRRALCQAATVMMHRGRATWSRTWAAKLARRRGAKRAMVALARRIAVNLRRMWRDDIDFRFDTPVEHAC